MIVAGVYASILAAVLTMRALRGEFKALELEQENLFDSIPRSWVRALGDVAVHTSPIAIGAIWIWLLIVGRY